MTLSTTPDKLFFGESGHGISRYDTLRYPVLDKINERMKSLFWQPKEFDMSQERRSFNSMTAAEQFVFTSNLKRQILLDSIQGRAPVLAFLEHCTDPMLENCILTWSFFESIHSESYTHPIRAIYPDPSVVVDDMPNIKEIVDCAQDITSAYENLRDNPCKDTLYLALIAANALEAIRFYVSFACTFSFLERGLVEGSAKLVRAIARDEHCLMPGTEVLTNRGWVTIDDVQCTDMVAQMSLDGSQRITFANPIKKIWKDYSGEMINVVHRTSKKVIQSVTADHDLCMLHRTKSGVETFTKVKAKDAKFTAYDYIPVSGVVSGSRSLTPVERLLIAIQADGNIPKRYTGAIAGSVPARIFVSKQRKIERLRSILSEVGFSYKESEAIGHGRKASGVIFYIDIPLDCPLDKNFDWVDLGTIDTNWSREFMAELVEWDGFKPKDGEYFYYSNVNKSAVDKVQAILALSGYRHRYGIQVDNRKETFSDVHRIYWWHDDRIPSIPSQSLIKESFVYSGKVGCLTMPEGTIVTRHNGNVSVTGNCHLALVSTIIKLLPQDDPEWVDVIARNQAKAVAIFESAANQEKEWAKYIFQHGAILGLNEQIMCQYIDYLMPRRLKAVGLPHKQIKTDHPLPWIEKHFSSASVQVAPQETEVGSYLTSSIDNDLGATDFSTLWK